jgi:hypothetical protein
MVIFIVTALISVKIPFPPQQTSRPIARTSVSVLFREIIAV